jgi:hypothetical protein
MADWKDDLADAVSNKFTKEQQDTEAFNNKQRLIKERAQAIWDGINSHKCSLGEDQSKSWKTGYSAESPATGANAAEINSNKFHDRIADCRNTDLALRYRQDNHVDTRPSHR